MTDRQADERNYGLDALRIVSMCMVVILHILGHGGILDSCEVNSGCYYVAWFIEILAYCAVNVFAITTGYLMICRPFRYSRMLSYWVQAVCYLLTIGLIAKLTFAREITGNQIIKAFFPVSGKAYWYFTAYIGLLFLMPFLNRMFNALSPKEARTLVWTMLFLFSGVGIFRDAFEIQNGYSVWWIAVLYLFGGYIRIYAPEIRTPKWQLAGMYLGMSLIMWQANVGIRTCLKF